MARVLLSFGSNLGEPAGRLAAGLARLDAVVPLLRVSSLYCTEPLGHSAQPDFLNLVCMGESGMDPHDLLRATRVIEDELGRERSFPNAPRTLDIDLLDVGGVNVGGADLELPHPRMAGRAFVLVPLAEILPDWRHPVDGRTAGEMLAELGTHERVERVGPAPDFRSPPASSTR